MQDKTVNLHSFFMTKTSDTSPAEGNITPESPLRTAGRHSSKSRNHSLEGWHPSAFHLPHGILCNRPPPYAHVTLARCPSHHHPMPMSPPPHAYVNFARCPSHHRHMPISPPPDAYVATATCLSHIRQMPISPPPHAYVATATCLCHSGDMPMSLWRDAYVTTCDMPMSPK